MTPRYDGANLIQGEAGTSVELEIQGTDGTVRTVAVTRAQMETDPVEYELLESGVGYIQVKNFYRRSADRVKEAVDDLVAQGATALVFDMRNNGGGYLDELTEMLDYLLPEGPIFRQQDRDGHETVTNSDSHCIDLPMATLVNANTYSAAEFFGAELQEQGVGVIVGEPTSGKGYSQQTFPLPSGGGLGLSTEKYFTGNGVSLIGTGVTLDREVYLSEEEGQLLQAASCLTRRTPSFRLLWSCWASRSTTIRLTQPQGCPAQDRDWTFLWHGSRNGRIYCPDRSGRCAAPI